MAFSGMEWVLVLVVVVVVFFGGAKVIPQFARSMGRARGEFDRAKHEVEKEIAAERAKGLDVDICAKCGTRLRPDEVKCLSCGSVRDRAAAPVPVALAAR